MLPCPIKPVDPLLPHSGKMVLLDEISAYDEHGLHALAHIAADCILLPEGANALPVWLAAEIMAQGIGAWAGAHALARGEKVRLGFLLGTRKLVFGRTDIPVGTQLELTVEQSWYDAGGMAVFDCCLICRCAAAGYEHEMPEGMVLAEGKLNVYSPNSDDALESLLKGAEAA